jgi:hypothetical protein
MIIDIQFFNVIFQSNVTNLDFVLYYISLISEII